MLDPEELVPERMRPLHRSEYEQLIAAGAFEDERVELLRGVLVEMSPQGGPHSGISARIANVLTLALQGTVEVRSHSPFAASDDSMPEPDVQVVPNGSRLTHPETALLVVEVAESSLRKDRRIKAGIYASNGVAEYWIVDVVGEVVEIYSDPQAGRYTSVTRVGRGGTLCPIAFPGVTLDVNDVFGLVT